MLLKIVRSPRFAGQYLVGPSDTYLSTEKVLIRPLDGEKPVEDLDEDFIYATVLMTPQEGKNLGKKAIGRSLNMTK